MLVIGLTGGIGSGKSTAAALFAGLGVPVIDADQIARDLTLPGAPGWERIVAAFGPALLAPDGTLDRAALRRRVFASEEERLRLEQLLHPLIEELMVRRLEELSAPYAIVVVPLLFEKGWQRLVDRVLVVDAPEDLQIARSSTREGVDEETVRAVMAAQLDRPTRLNRADDIICNDGDLTALRAQVLRLHQKYLQC